MKGSCHSKSFRSTGYQYESFESTVVLTVQQDVSKQTIELDANQMITINNSKTSSLIVIGTVYL